MKYVFLFLLVSLLSFQSYAQDGQGTGPYKRESKANLAQRIIHVLDNATVGGVQTVLGAGHILVFGILNPIIKKKFALSTHHNSKSEVDQIIVEMDNLYSGNYSLGLFQIGDYKGNFNHEGGHSVASAALGPVYLPMVAFSYLAERGRSNNGIMEIWADMEANPSPYLNTMSAQVGLGGAVLDGEHVPVVVFKFALEQRQLQSSKDVIETDKIFSWINTKVVVPFLIKDTPLAESPVLVEFDLLRKKLNLIIDNIPVYLEADQSLRHSIQTEQVYGHIENNPSLKRIHIRALEWSFKYGLQYNLGNTLQVTPRVGLGLGLGAMSEVGNDYRNFSFQDKYRPVFNFKFNVGIDIKFKEYATLTGEYEREYFTNGLVRSTWNAQLHNDLRNPFNKIGFIQYFDWGTGFRSDTYELNGQKNQYDQWNAVLGVRF